MARLTEALGIAELLAEISSVLESTPLT